jgi:hypothetical protein
MRNLFNLAATGGVDDEYLICQSGREFVPLTGGLNRRAWRPFLERRKNQQTLRIQGSPPIDRDSDSPESTRQANDHGLCPSQQYP